MENKEKTLEQLEAARLKVQQYEHKIQLLKNRKNHLEKKADRQRTHHLCNMGGAIQSISKEADSLTRVQVHGFPWKETDGLRIHFAGASSEGKGNSETD